MMDFQFLWIVSSILVSCAILSMLLLVYALIQAVKPKPKPKPSKPIDSEDYFEW